MAAVDRRLLRNFDWTLLTIVLGLCALGVVSVMSASYAGSRRVLDPLVVRQLIWIGVGTMVMTGALLFDYRAMMTYAYPIYALTLGLLVAVSVIGHSTGGSRRWINLGFFHL